MKIPWLLETDRPYPTSLRFTPTPLEVAESSIVALIIYSVFNTNNTALLQVDQRYEVGAGLIRKLIKQEWGRGAPRMARYVGMMHNCERAKVVMGLVDAGTILQHDEYVLPPLE